ncbi:sugar lactone lactonase YvrE [Chryseobacterium ginsenosidimutans]|uniref:L-dopachrome tautomerase-related protein n=1 Tax=Chryseobacterium ginsenosidimutans TaxID=687846 RepID=UPI002786178E|nr:L-dopachrome tautomerase-related protein [Chryseobacterium ginsenosidimutans]MDQ0593642.1 sugar lactone lactonase YvrE [Chryseobacterium ginsenosidimutans]
MKAKLIAMSLFLSLFNSVKAQLQKVAISNIVWNGVTTSSDGRIFVNFPRIEGDKGMRIGEVLKNGNIIPYPNKDWNNWENGADVNNKFVRTNSLRIGPDGLLWIVDTGTPSMGQDPLLGNALKLVSIDIKTNTVQQIIPLSLVSKPSTFIDDLRIVGNTIYLTDAGEPALIILDKRTGKGRRVLESHTSTTDNLPIKAEGKIMKDKQGNEVRIHADQLEISPDGKWLYFQPASGPLWKVETQYLNNHELSETDLESKVSLFYNTPSTGGTAIDADGNIYVSDVNLKQIIKITSDGKESLVIKDEKLLWADALWIDDNGYLWIPTGQLNRLAAFQKGINQVQFPVVIYKLKVEAKPTRN